MSTVEVKKDSYAALRVADFRNLIFVRFFITIALQIQAVVVGWQVYELTKDPLSLGLIGLAEAVPAITVSLYAGHVVDKTSRKKTLTICYIVLLINAVGLHIISANYFGLTVEDSVIGIYVMIFSGGVARGFLFPAVFAFLSQLISKELLPNGITWNTSAWQIAAITGPALAGFVYGAMGFSNTYILIAVLVCISLFLLILIKKRPMPEISGEEKLSDRLTAGVKFVWNNKIVLGAISLDLFAVLFGGAVALLPIFSAEILNVGVQGLGILRAAPSVGAVIMALLMTKFSPIANAGRNLLVSVFLYGLSMMLFALSKDFWLSVTALALSGLFDSVSVVIRGTIMQLKTPDNMKGRVSAVNSVFIGSSNEIGAFESGVAAKLMGVVPSVIFGAAMTLIVVGVTTYVSPTLRKLKL